MYLNFTLIALIDAGISDVEYCIISTFCNYNSIYTDSLNWMLARINDVEYCIDIMESK